MAKTVGFACSIKLQWIKRTIQLLEEGHDKESFKKELNDYLSFEIEGPTRLRKTREILMNMWYYELDDVSPARKEALSLIEKYPEYIVPISLCILYLAYPVVADVCKFMGRMFEAHDEITNAMLKQKLFDEWGERGTLEATSRRVTLTLKELGLIKDASRTRYILTKQEITNTEVINFVIATIMKIDGGSYYSFSELHDFVLLFPFDYNVSKEELITNNRYTVSTFGGEVSVSLRE